MTLTNTSYTDKNGTITLADGCEVMIKRYAKPITVNEGFDVESNLNLLIEVSINRSLTLKNITIDGHSNKNTVGNENEIANGVNAIGQLILVSWNSKLTISNSTLQNNVATANGGAVFNKNIVILEQDSKILNNKSTGLGGGIYNAGTMKISDTTVKNNTSEEKGGGIYSTGPIEFINSNVSNNEASQNGGGIYNVGSFVLTSGTITENNAVEGAGVYNSGKVTINGGTVLNNTASQNGGGLYNTGSLILTAGEINDNDASDGGGIYNAGNIKLSGTKLSDNRATNKGNAIYNTSGDVINGLSNILESGLEFNAHIPSEASSILFTDEKAPESATLIDVSAARDMGVVAWLDGTVFKISTQRAGLEIMANKDCTYMFGETYYDIESIQFDNLNTSNVENMSWMFYCCWGLTELDVSMFDVRKVTDMTSMFYMCDGLKSLDLSTFDTKNVVSMNSMLYALCSAESINLTGKFNTSSVVDMSYMFMDIYSMDTIDLRNFDTSNVKYMTFMFSDSDFKTLNLSGFDTSNVIDMSYMFANCYELTKLDLTNFDTSNVTNMEYAFDNMRRLQQITVGENFSFVGIRGTLDKTESKYVSGATGNWYNTQGDVFELDTNYIPLNKYDDYVPVYVPENKADTYFALPSLVTTNVEKDVPGSPDVFVDSGDAIISEMNNTQGYINITAGTIIDNTDCKGPSVYNRGTVDMSGGKIENAQIGIYNDDGTVTMIGLAEIVNCEQYGVYQNGLFQVKDAPVVEQPVFLTPEHFITVIDICTSEFIAAMDEADTFEGRVIANYTFEESKQVELYSLDSVTQGYADTKCVCIGDKELAEGAYPYCVLLISEPKYTIQYNGNGSTSGEAPTDDTNYLIGDTATVKDKHTLEKEGYQFAGWNTEADGNGTHYDPEDTFEITESIVLYAQWLKAEKASNGSTDGVKPGDEIVYTITVVIPEDADKLTIRDKIPEGTVYVENSATESVTYADGTLTWEFANIKANEEVKVCFKVTTNGNLANKTDICNTASVNIGENAHIYQTNTVTDKYIASYNIYYALDGGENNPDNPDKYIYGVGVNKFFEPTKEDHKFIGWYEDPEFETPIDSIGKECEGDVTLYAKWDKEPEISVIPEPGTEGTEDETGSILVFYEGQIVTKEMLLENVTAEDKEDGDLTDKLRITKISYAEGNLIDGVDSSAHNMEWEKDAPDDYLLHTWFLEMEEDAEIIYNITYAVTDSAENEVELPWKIKVVYNEYPIITGQDEYYFTLEEAQNGNITEKAMLEDLVAADLLNATDIEDDEWYPGTIPQKIQILDFYSEQFTTLTGPSYIRLHYSVTDSLGKEAIFEVKVIVTQDGNMPIIKDAQQVRFIDKTYYNQSLEKGGLNDHSYWYTDSSYSSVLLPVLDLAEQKNSSPLYAYHYGRHEVKTIQKNFSYEKNKDEDNLNKFIENWMRETKK